MPSRPRRLIAATLVAGMAPMGFAASAGFAATPSFAAAQRADTTTPPPAALAIPASPSAAGRKSVNPPKTCNNKDMSGCFTYAQTQKIADYSIQYVIRAVAKMYPNLPKPKHYWYVPQGTAYAWCKTRMTDTAFGYCYLDRTIALGQRALWEFYDRAGDAAPLVGVAHEYAHHIQVMKGVRPPRTPRESIRFENQADCLAGAVVRQLRRVGVFTDQDLRDVDDLIPLIASAEGTHRDHGTSQERVKAIYTGIRYGARTCGKYVPGAPRVG